MSIRSKVSELECQAKQQVREHVEGKQIFFIVDESEINATKFMNILVGYIDVPETTYLLDCTPLSTNVNANVVCQCIDDCIWFLGTSRHNFVLLLSDAAKYMVLAGFILKSMYPQLFHITCVCHLFHNCAMRLHSHFPDVAVHYFLLLKHHQISY